MGALLPGTTYALREYDTWRPIPDRAWELEPDESLGSLHAAVIYNGTIIDDRDRSAEKTRFSRYVSVCVFDDAGIEEFGSQEIPYFKEAKLRHLHARTVKPDGSEIILDEEDFHDKVIVRMGQTDVRAKAFAFKGVEAGDIIEYYVAFETPFGSFPTVQLQSHTLTEWANVAWHFWRAPKGWQGILPSPKWVVTNAEKYGGSVAPTPSEEDPDYLDVTFRKLPAMPGESYGPPEADDAVHFYGCYSWPLNVARKSYWKLFSDYMGAGTLEFLSEQEALDDWARSSEDGQRFDRDLRECVRFVHERVRNVDLLPDDEELPELPDIHTVDALLEHGSGASYHINALVVAMLRRLGYDATVFWARSVSTGTFLEDWENGHQFDMSGVAISLGTRTRWCYPALPLGADGSLPWEVQGCRALLENVWPEQVQKPLPMPFIDIPTGEPDHNRRETNVKLSLAPDGRARGTLDAEWSCRNDLFFVQDMALRDEAEAIESFRDVIFTGVDWVASDEEIAVKGTSISYSCSLEIASFFAPVGPKLLATPGKLRRDDYRLPPGQRETAILFRYPCTFRTYVSIDLPDGCTPEIPQPVELASGFAEYRFEPTRIGNRIEWDRSLTLLDNRFPAAAQETLRDFFESVYQADATPLVLSRSDTAEDP